MSLIRIRRERKDFGSSERKAMPTRTLLLMLAFVLFAIWYLTSSV